MTEYQGTLGRAEILNGWMEGTRLGLRLRGELRDFELDPEPMGLSWMMEFDTVIYSFGDGRHAQEVSGIFAPVAFQERDEHGEWLDPTLETDGNGWQLMSGYSGQHQYNGPWMHRSEFIGGLMRDDILATAGLYAAIFPAMLGNEEYEDPDTWAVAYISENIPGSQP